MLIADGLLCVKVTEILQNEIKTIALNDCILGEYKNMNLGKGSRGIETITEKDIVDIVDFGYKYDVDMISLSFVKDGKDVIQCRKLLKDKAK